MIFPNVGGAIDAILDLCPKPDGVVVDDGLTEPASIEPNRLYAWPRRIAPAQGETAFDIGSFRAETTLEVRVLLSLPSKGEPRVKRADRTLTDALLAGTGAIIAALLEHDQYPDGSGALWQSLMIAGVVPDAARTVKARGYIVDVRLSLPWPDDLDDTGGGS